MNWPPEYIVKTHPRARYVKLRAHATRGLIVTVPPRFNQREIPEILERHRAWIIRRLSALPAAGKAELPDAIAFRAINKSVDVQYIACASRKIEIIERPAGDIVLAGDTSNRDTCLALLTAWVRKQSRFHLLSMLEEVSMRTQLEFARASVRGQETLWGSCTSSKAISLNYKLIFIPRHLAQHIMIHELSHTRHLNHSRRFWEVVATHDPAWNENRQAMRRADSFVPAWLTGN